MEKDLVLHFSMQEGFIRRRVLTYLPSNSEIGVYLAPCVMLCVIEIAHTH